MKRASAVAGGAVVLAGVAVVTVTMARHWWADVAARREGNPKGRALVVFGGAVSQRDPCPELRARLDHALTLWQGGAAPSIVVSGGIDRGVDEVTVMADYLVRQGVPAAAVVPGRPGDNTRATVATMARLELDPYVAVSSGYHMRRILRESRRHGMTVVASAPTESPESRHRRAYVVRLAVECAASAWYAVPRRWSAPVTIGRWRHWVPVSLIGRRPQSPGYTDDQRCREVADE